MSAVDIVYLHPPRNASSALYIAIPVGVFGIVNNLRKLGFSVRGYNIPLEMKLYGYFDFAKLARDLPRIVLIDLHWYEHSAGAIDVARSVKAVLPNAIVIVGGLTATIFAKELAVLCPEIDYIIRGEAEDPTAELVQSLFGQGRVGVENVNGLTCRWHGGLLHTPISFRKGETADFDYVEFCWLSESMAYLHSTPSGINSPRANFWLMTGTGCQFNCAYCGGSRDAMSISFGRNSLWKRSPSRIAADIARLVETGVEIINPTHDFSSFGPAFWEILFSLLRLQDVKVGCYHELFQLPSRHFIDAFAATFDLSSSTLVFSPLAGEDEVRSLNGKGYKNSALIDRLELCHQRGIRASISFSENLPGTMRDGARHQEALIEKARKAYPNVDIHSQMLTLDPNSNMASSPGNFGLRKNFASFRDYVAYSAGNNQNGYELIR